MSKSRVGSTKSELVFAFNDLRLRLSAASLNLLSLDGPGGRWLAPSGETGAPLWSLLAVDREGRRAWLNSANAANAAAVREQADGVLRLAWTDVCDAKTAAGPFDVAVEIRPHESCAAATAWGIRVENRSDDWTLWGVTFPNLQGLEASARPARDRFFWPDGWGAEYAGSQMPRLHRRYPRGWETTMQFFGYTRGDRTLYLGVHDPRLTTKDFAFEPPSAGAKKHAGSLAVTAWPEGMTCRGNSLAAEYDVVLAVVAGDWFDAAQIYGSWARRQAFAAVPPAAAAAVPRAAREVHAWQVMQVPDRPLDQWAALMERLAARLGVLLGIHFYNWHEIPFDTSYPDYFPARAGFRELVARMNALGIVTMPYINGRLWDINARSWPEQDAQRFAAKGSAQRVQSLSLFPYLEEYGSGQKLAVMCPATDFWRNTVIELCRRIVHELGCRGVYIDQIAAEKAELCFDPTHGHPLGGGGFWLEGYRTMAAAIREAVGPEAWLTTECNWEGCAADYDALLSWHRFGEEQVPIFPAVYAGLARLFGSKFSARDIAEQGGEAFARKMSMLLAWGGQLGWGDLTPLLEPKQAGLLRYFASLCKLRAEHAGTFADGRMLRPPVVASCRFAGKGGSAETRPGRNPVYASLWQAGDVGAVTLFVVNPTRTPADVKLKLTAAEVGGLAPAGRAARGITSRRTNAGLVIEAKLRPLQALAVPLGV
ncbi:MAG TPA: DUF6259 domain-containing protein [Planctomycetota bacterium]|nr:DUF6259 domain-containing protein [Planctomycetota bacterium]